MKNIMDAHCGKKFNLEGDRRGLFKEREESQVSSLEGRGRRSGVVGGGDIFCVEE